jgi:hypothetical protein
MGLGLIGVECVYQDSFTALGKINILSGLAIVICVWCFLPTRVGFYVRISCLLLYEAAVKRLKMSILNPNNERTDLNWMFFCRVSNLDPYGLPLGSRFLRLSVVGLFGSIDFVSLPAVT